MTSQTYGFGNNLKPGTSTTPGHPTQKVIKLTNKMVPLKGDIMNKPEHKPKKEDSELKTLEKKLQKRDQLISDYINHIKRSQADFENYKKRIEKERECASQRELEKLASNLLPILDNLERALAASKKNHDIESLISGIEMTQKNLCGILEKEGLEKIDCTGKEFDPNLHEAIMTIESKDHKDNTVCEELEKGYTFKNKLIRASKVKVVKNE